MSSIQIPLCAISNVVLKPVMIIIIGIPYFVVANVRKLFFAIKATCGIKTSVNACALLQKRIAQKVSTSTRRLAFADLAKLARSALRENTGTHKFAPASAHQDAVRVTEYGMPSSAFAFAH